jgi:hypothetical protein
MKFLYIIVFYLLLQTITPIFLNRSFVIKRIDGNSVKEDGEVTFTSESVLICFERKFVKAVHQEDVSEAYPRNILTTSSSVKQEPPQANPNPNEHQLGIPRSNLLVKQESTSLLKDHFPKKNILSSSSPARQETKADPNNITKNVLSSSSAKQELKNKNKVTILPEITEITYTPEVINKTPEKKALEVTNKVNDLFNDLRQENCHFGEYGKVIKAVNIYELDSSSLLISVVLQEGIKYSFQINIEADVSFEDLELGLPIMHTSYVSAVCNASSIKFSNFNFAVKVDESIKIAYGFDEKENGFYLDIPVNAPEDYHSGNDNEFYIFVGKTYKLRFISKVQRIDKTVNNNGAKLEIYLQQHKIIIFDLSSEENKNNIVIKALEAKFANK